MVMVDTTIVNVALPSIQSDLDVSLSRLEWTVNAFLVVYAGLLLTGGRPAATFPGAPPFSPCLTGFPRRAAGGHLRASADVPPRPRDLHARLARLRPRRRRRCADRDARRPGRRRRDDAARDARADRGQLRGGRARNGLRHLGGRLDVRPVARP